MTVVMEGHRMDHTDAMLTLDAHNALWEELDNLAVPLSLGTRQESFNFGVSPFVNLAPTPRVPPVSIASVRQCINPSTLPTTRIPDRTGL